MDEAIEHFKVILKTAIKTETTPLLTEITALKEKVTTLTAAMNEKDRQCRHLMNLLHTKNTEWKRIKSELMQRRSGATFKVAGDAKTAEDLDVLDTMEAKSFMKSVGTVDEDSLNDCTQLPSHAPLPRHVQLSSPPSHLSPQSSHSQTQSNLDALFSLISDPDSDPEIENISPGPAANRSSLAGFDSGGKRKRKSHARGCVCCDKYYAATRSAESSNNFTSADSFIVTPKTPPGFWDTSFTPRQ